MALFCHCSEGSCVVSLPGWTYHCFLLTLLLNSHSKGGIGWLDSKLWEKAWTVELGTKWHMLPVDDKLVGMTQYFEKHKVCQKRCQDFIWHLFMLIEQQGWEWRRGTWRKNWRAVRILSIHSNLHIVCRSLVKWDKTGMYCIMLEKATISHSVLKSLCSKIRSIHLHCKHVLISPCFTNALTSMIWLPFPQINFPVKHTVIIKYVQLKSKFCRFMCQ